MTDEEDDDSPQLSAAAVDALQQFYGERDSRAKQFEDMKLEAENDFDDRPPLSMEAFSEDWNASQFWYDDATATTLAQEILKNSTKETYIAIVSAPSVFIQIKNILNQTDLSKRPRVHLLEFDERFSVFKEFTAYDFEHPLRLPAEFKGRFDRIICDPPFLSSDCQTKTALTVRYLSKSWASPTPSGDANPHLPDSTGLHLIICTGERLETLVHKLYSKVGLRTTAFLPKHAKGLSNEFRCYANFEGGAWQLR